MERTDRSEKDESQKIKLIVISAAAAALIFIIWSFVSASNARKERDAARQEIELSKQENAKLEQMLTDQNLALDDLRKKLQECELKAKAKPVVKPVVKKPAPKPAVKKKTTPSKKAAAKKKPAKTKKRP